MAFGKNISTNSKADILAQKKNRLASYNRGYCGEFLLEAESRKE